MTTPRIKTTRTGRKRTIKTQAVDLRLTVQGKPLSFWLPDNKTPLIDDMMKEWGDDLRHLSSVDGYHLIYWLIDQIIKRQPDHKPSPEAVDFYGRIGELSPAEMGRIIQAIMHRKKG